MKKAVSLLIALAVLLTLVTLPALADGERTKVTVAIYERGNTTAEYGTVTDNYWTRWVQENFGDPNNIDVEYVPFSRAESDSILNTWMAGGSAPDIIFSYSSTMIMDYGKDGGLVDMADLLPEYGPNILANMEPTLSYGQYEGHQYALVALRADVGRYADFIRKDWLDKMGYTLERSEDGFYHISVEDFSDMLHKAKELDLDGTGMEIYPLGMAGAYQVTQTRPIIYAFLNLEELTDEIHACYNEMFWPGYKDGVRFLNQMYNDGLVDPDFMVDTDTSYPAMTSLISNGRTLGYGQDNFYRTGVEALYDNNPDAEVVCFILDNVYGGANFVDVYAPTGMYIAIPATCQNPENAVKYLNFLADYDTAKTLQYGFEGVHYEMKDGNPVTIAYTDEEKAKIDCYLRTTCGDMVLVYNGNPFGYVTSLEGLSEVEARVQGLMNEAKAMSKVGGVPGYYFQGIKTEAQEEYDGFLPNLQDSMAALITCSPDDFDAMYDAALQEYLDAGGQEVIDAQIALYNELEAAK